jgi:hypothetical protein
MNDLLLLGGPAGRAEAWICSEKESRPDLGTNGYAQQSGLPSLRRFVGNRSVTRRKTAGERGQVRQAYSLTPAGRKLIIEQVCDLGDRVIESAEEFRLRAGFFSILTSSAREEILEKRKALPVASRRVIWTASKGNGAR